VAPIGVPGEIHIGGIALGRGYQKRPDLTAEIFIPDTLSGQEGSRIYRTGDLGRCREGGEIEFIGRIDNQVKVRGYRIELGEVEAVLEAHPKVREAVAAVRQGQDGEKRLFGYVVKEGEEAPAEWELRKYMRELVPDFMVPSEFIVMEEMPLTVNGKVDRSALPERDGRLRQQEHQAVAARNETEEALAAVWREALGVNEVGVTDSFFDLGGHSLLGIQLIAKVTERFGVELPLSSLFESPTIEGLAESIVNAQRSSDSASPDIIPVSRDRYRIEGTASQS
jgi:acyl carrier protein